MPELESLIATWRTTLDQTVGDPDTIRELESHLRDHVEALMRTGVPGAAAFEQAKQRLGEPQALAQEFALARRRRWLPESAAECILLLLALTVAFVTCLLATKYAAGRMTLVIATHVFALVTGYLIVFATGLIAGCALFTAWRRPLLEHERAKLRRVLFRLTAINTACLPVGIALGMWWAARNLGHAWSWTQGETGAAFVFLSSLLLLIAQLRRVPDNARYVIAVIGSVSLVSGWSWARAATGGVPIVYLCLAFAIAQIAVLLLRSATQRETAAD